MITTEILLLLVAFQVKHFLCDYPLQGRYMLGKFNDDWSFFGPLAAHCGVHTLFTVIISAFWTGDLRLSIALGLFDFVVHFIMDRIKAGKKYLGRFDDKMKPYFWWCLGLDQMVHHLTHYFIIYQIITATPNSPFTIFFSFHGLPGAAFAFSAVTAVFSILAYSKVVGMEKSTHQVAWMPVEEPTVPEAKTNEDGTFKRDIHGNMVNDVPQFVKDMGEHMYPDIESEQL